MKRSDFAVVGAIYAVALFFYVQLLDLPEAAQTYPLGLIIALVALTTLYFVKQIWVAKKEGRIHNDIPVIFKKFEPMQFVVISVACIAYLVMMIIFGYYISSLVFLVGTMCYLRVPLWQTLLTVVVLFAMIYGVFTVFLSVPLPTGLLFN